MSLDPFARTTMRIVQPLELLSHDYDGTSQTHTLEYRAPRGASASGLITTRFKVGAVLVVGGGHLAVTGTSITVTTGAIDETAIRVTAVSFADVFAKATAHHSTPRARAKGLAPVAPFTFGTNKRRILL